MTESRKQGRLLELSMARGALIRRMDHAASELEKTAFKAALSKLSKKIEAVNAEYLR